MHLDKVMIFSQYVHNFFHSMLNLADMCKNKHQEDLYFILQSDSDFFHATFRSIIEALGVWDPVDGGLLC